MFVRSVKIPSSNGTVHEYVRIVSSVREDGKVKQKVIANLGRRDRLEAVLPLLNRFLKGDDDQAELARQLGEESPIEVLDASTWGPKLVARHFFDPDLVMYDLTSTYFEGQGPALAKHGYSRDGKPRNVQVVVGMVMVAGWPIAHHVWAGNGRDGTTVKEVAEEIGAAVERALQKHRGYRYYGWELKEGRLEIFEHPVNLPREKKYEGKYLIQTDQTEMTPQEAVSHYKDLNDPRLLPSPASPKSPEAKRPPSPNCPPGRRNHNVVTNPKSGPCATRTYDETC